VRVALTVLCLCFFHIAAFADDIKMPVKLDSEGFNNVFADAGKVFISGQPTIEGLKRLKALGIDTVINLRPSSEMDNRERVPFDEAAALKELGMRYINIPVGGNAHPFTPSALEKFAAAMKHLKGKTLVHCSSARRASHMWTAYLAKHEGMDINNAIAHGRAINLDTPAFENLLGTNMGYTYNTP